ncbi:putative tetratricopeptide repeat protein 1 [Viridothelium virens]|uniref:Putative tetratricopeptide repeat protein 1 n=1 Tax=Viridothelium virens TaxID=1048519 RepID=A0A6A6HPG0_VIRVR|nr:putative tetratricopeptide repeat protein 1 [Viridothelium virens]
MPEETSTPTPTPIPMQHKRPPPTTSSRSEIASHEEFSPEEEANLVTESNAHKASANTQFAHGAYGEAIQTYDKALASCPAYLDYELAVLRSNIAACHIKLSEWKEAIEAADRSLEGLERVDPTPKTTTAVGKDGENEAVEEVNEQTAARIEAFEKSGRNHGDVQRIRIKVLLRRARARMETGGWAALQGAEEDYKQLIGMQELQATDKKAVDKALRELPPRLEEAKSKEMGDMMGKLKDLGNGILKPFGLSTDNFQFVKDEKSGGYSVNFNQDR